MNDSTTGGTSENARHHEAHSREPHSYQGRRISNTLYNSIILCLVETPWWLATVALVFFGSLIEFYAMGATLLLLGTIASMAITSYFSSWRGTVWIPQDVPAAILAITTVELISKADPETSSSALFVTVIALIAISTLSTGGLLYVLGRFRLGNLVRYLPFPVIAGFLGGTGWLLLKAGVDVSMGDVSFGSYWQPDVIIRWLPAIALALTGWWLGRRISHPLLLPGLMLFATLAFHLLLFIAGSSATGTESWMFSALSPDAQSTALTLAEVLNIDWLAIASHGDAILVLAVASVISMLLNNSGFELQVGRDFDINKDLRVAGVANMAGGLVGGWPGYMSPASSLINARQGQQLPATGPIVGIGVALVVWFAIPLLSLAPLFVLGSGVAFIGTLFIADWVFDSYRKLTKSEYLVVLCIVATIALLGLAQGVIVGMLLTVALFLVTFSQVDVIRHQMTGKHRRSRVKRTSAEHNWLLQTGHQTQLFQLQGYLFFGTANQLLESIRATINGTDTRYIVIDFERVPGVDSTATSSFLKLQKDAGNQNINVVFASLDNKSRELLEQQFRTAGVTLPDQFPNIDAALESIEKRQLSNGSAAAPAKAKSLNEYLYEVVPEANNIDTMLGLMERCELKAGDYLIHQGDLATEMFFIESGSITAQIEHANARAVRLETMGHGVVGELAFYLGNRRTAAVVCNDDVPVYRLTRDRLSEIENNHPKEASTLHLILAKLLSERTTHLIAQIAALQK